MFYSYILHGMMSALLIVQDKDEQYLVTITSTRNSASAHKNIQAIFYIREMACLNISPETSYSGRRRDEHPHKLLSRVKPTTPARRRIYHKGTEALAHRRSGRQTYTQKSVSSIPHHTHGYYQIFKKPKAAF